MTVTMSVKPKKTEVHVPLLYKDIVSPWEIGVASRTNGTRLRRFYRVILQRPFGGSPRRPLMHCIHEDKAASAVLRNHPQSHWHKQTSASRFCSAFLVGWLGILLCVNFIWEFTLMEKHLSGPRLVTTAGSHGLATCAMWRITSYFHSHFFGQTKPYAHGQLQLGEDAQSFQVVRRGRPSTGEQPNLSHPFPSKRRALLTCVPDKGGRGSDWELGGLCLVPKTKAREHFPSSE